MTMHRIRLRLRAIYSYSLCGAMLKTTFSNPIGMMKINGSLLALLLTVSGQPNADELWWSAHAISNDKKITISIVSSDERARWHACDFRTGQQLNISDVQILAGGTSFSATIFGSSHVFYIYELLYNQFHQCNKFEFHKWAFKMRFLK